MKARLIATGERAPSWVAQGFAEYQKRLSHWLPFELVEIEPGLRGRGVIRAAPLKRKASGSSLRCRRTPMWWHWMCQDDS